MEVFTNENGNTYQILKHYGDEQHNYALLANQDDEQYIVVQNLHADEHYWERGDYFSQVLPAQQQFEQAIYNEVIPRLAQVSKQCIQAAAYDNLIRDNGEALAWIERSDFYDELYSQTKHACDYDLDRYEEQFQAFGHQLADDAFLDIIDTDTGIEILVGYAHLYDRDVERELHQIPQIVESQLQSVNEAAAWLSYYQSYHCEGIPEAVFIILQAPAIVEQCLAKVATAQQTDLATAQEQYPSMPIQAIYNICTNHQQHETQLTKEYQHFFNYLQQLSWEHDERPYSYLAKFTQKLIKDSSLSQRANWEELQQFCGIEKAQVLAQIKTQQR